MPKKILLKWIWCKCLTGSAKVSEDIPNTINESCKDITYENPPQIIFQKPIFCMIVPLYQPRWLQKSLRTDHGGDLTRRIGGIIIIPNPLFWLSSFGVSIQRHRHRRQGNDPCSGLSPQLRQHSAIERTSGGWLVPNPNPCLPHSPIRQLHVHRSRRRLPSVLSHRSTPYTAWISTRWCHTPRWSKEWAERSRGSRCLTYWIERKQRSGDNYWNSRIDFECKVDGSCVLSPMKTKSLHGKTQSNSFSKRRRTN